MDPIVYFSFICICTCLLFITARLSARIWKLRHDHLLLESRVWLLEQQLRFASDHAAIQKVPPPPKEAA